MEETHSTYYRPILDQTAAAHTRLTHGHFAMAKRQGLLTSSGYRQALGSEMPVSFLYRETA